MSDSLKAVGTSVSTIMVNVWNIVPEALGALLIVLNIIYVILKIEINGKFLHNVGNNHQGVKNDN